MPTYDYLCEACGHKFELFQSMTDPVRKKCPACKKSKLRRLFGTGAAVMFKGSGFYQTDYRSDSYKKAASADSNSGEGKSSKTSEKASETKSPSGGEGSAVDKSSGDKSSSKSKSQNQ